MDSNFQNQGQSQMMSYYHQSGYAPSMPTPQSSGPPLTAPSVSIWAGDLDSYMDETFLRNAVAACGWAADITRIKVVRDRYNGMHAGYGFLDAASPEAAARVLATGSGMPIPGTNRCWRLNMGRSAQSPAVPTTGAESNVYVGDLDPTVTDFQLLSAFRPRFPSTRHAKVVCNEFGQSRGFGFVRFANSIEAERAVQEMNGFEFHGKPIRLSPANGRTKGNDSLPAPGGAHHSRMYSAGHGGGIYHGHHHMIHGLGGPGGGPSIPTNKRPRQVMSRGDPNNSTLFIGGTGPHVTEEVLWREFSIFGGVEAVRVPVNKTGFAFVRFKSRENAQRAKDELSGTHFISLNPHKPVRLEWATEQLAITKPQTVSVGQGSSPPAMNQGNKDAVLNAQVTVPLSSELGAESIPSASGSGVDSSSDCKRPVGTSLINGSVGGNDSDGPPTKRPAVSRNEYSQGNGTVESAVVQPTDEPTGKSDGEKPTASHFPWLETQSGQKSSSPK